MEVCKNFQERVEALARARNTIKSYMDDKVPNCIEEGLYLGSIGAATQKSLLKELNVTHILTVACSFSPPYPEDFIYKVIEVVDREDANLEQHFDECIDFIDEAKRQGGGVLVHCIMGKSRSATIVAAYIMKKRRMRSAEALQFVRNKRPLVNPNAGFISQLHGFERYLERQGAVAAEAAATTATAIPDAGQQSN